MVMHTFDGGGTYPLFGHEVMRGVGRILNQCVNLQGTPKAWYDFNIAHMTLPHMICDATVTGKSTACYVLSYFTIA